MNRWFEKAIVIVFALTLVLLGGILVPACAPPDATSSPTPTSALKPTSLPKLTPLPAPDPVPTPTPALSLEYKIPLAVSGFDFVEKSDRVEPLFDGEEYSAVGFFTPKTNSKYENKVDQLTVYAYLFKDDSSSEKMVISLLPFGFQIGGGTPMLYQNKDNGETIVVLQTGRMVVYSLSVPPYGATTFDNEILKDASLEGYKAIR